MDINHMRTSSLEIKKISPTGKSNEHLVNSQINQKQSIPDNYDVG